jgi:5-methylcytosine-specific restriction endonuclease McrBC regulatory subunit McrC
VVTDETAYILRGRLRETEQLYRHHGLPVPLEIRHDEFAVDITENQILRAARERMLRGTPGGPALGACSRSWCGRSFRRMRRLPTSATMC